MGGDSKGDGGGWRVAAARAGGSEDELTAASVKFERPSDSEVGGEGSAGEGDGNEGSARVAAAASAVARGWVTQLRPAHTQRRDRERVAACARARVPSEWFEQCGVPSRLTFNDDLTDR